MGDGEARLLTRDGGAGVRSRRRPRCRARTHVRAARGCARRRRRPSQASPVAPGAGAHDPSRGEVPARDDAADFEEGAGDPERCALVCARAQARAREWAPTPQTPAAALGEFRIRELNDEINRLIKDKRGWERRISALGGADYGSARMLVRRPRRGGGGGGGGGPAREKTRAPCARRRTSTGRRSRHPVGTCTLAPRRSCRA